VVKDVARDDRVEAGVVLQFLELDRPEDRAVGGRRIDRGDLVAGRIERERELTSAAADLRYPRGSRGQMR
jgi:hypothetical protein